MKAFDALTEISRSLNACMTGDALKESEMILTRCLGIDRVTMYRDNPALTSPQMDKMGLLIKRRLKREPLQYIAGNVDFYGLTIKVGPGVLIPRPETELLVEEVLKTVSSKQSLSILDLCTGSGCIALALAKHLPEADIYATDISEKALGFAVGNARINNISNVKFINGSLFDPLKGMRFDIIVTNPPYIIKADISSLEPEIRDWEPFEALDGGEDGLDFYREIISSARLYLNDRGFVILEAGAGESGDIVRIAAESGLRCKSVIKDYAGIERVICLAI